MGNSKGFRNDISLSDKATLGLLNAIETGERITQRSLSARIGIALGLTNSLLKRCVHKGLVKVKDVPARRYAYYLTPKGFSEKSRLISEYLSSSLSFFRLARDEYNALFEDAKRQGCRRVAFYGAGELAEIAVLSAQEAEFRPVCVIAPGSNLDHFCGLKVVGDIEAADDLDAIVITTSDLPQVAYDTLSERFSAEMILTAPFLHVSRKTEAGEGKKGKVGRCVL